MKNSKKVRLVALFFLLVIIVTFVVIEEMQNAQAKREQHLFYAILRNDSGLLLQMIKEGHDVNTMWKGWSTTDAALKWTRPKVRERNYSLKELQAWDNRASLLISILIENGVNVDSLDPSLLSFAAYWHLENTARRLLEGGVNPNLGSKDYGVSPLHGVFTFYDDDWKNNNILKLLIDYGADVNCQDEEGNTPLHLAILYNADVSIIKYLLDAGALLSLQNGRGQTAFDIEKTSPNPNQQLLSLLKEN